MISYRTPLFTFYIYELSEVSVSQKKVGPSWSWAGEQVPMQSNICDN